MNEIIVSPIIEDNNGIQRIKGYQVHYPNVIKDTPTFKTKKRAFLFAHEQASITGFRVQEKGIHKPKLDTEKM